MNKLIRGFLIIAAAAVFFLPFALPAEARAEVTVIYDFTGCPVPAGQPAQLPVGAETIQAFRADPAVVVSFVQALAGRYNTEAGTIDQACETYYLYSVLNGTQQGGVHKPIYTGSPEAAAQVALAQQQSAAPAPVQVQAPVTGDLTINGGTYVDINKSTQTLTYFINGAPYITTPVVTGNVAAGNSTPSGAFSVQGKQRNRTLRGANYSAFVRYWVPIVRNIGIHDASWRGSFGGTIYQRSGSHGCINVPPANMPALYDSLNIGTPVIVH